MIISNKLKISILAIVIIVVAGIAVWQLIPTAESNPNPTPTPTTTPTAKPTANPTATPTATTTPTPTPTATPTPTNAPVAWNLNFIGGKTVNMTNIVYESQATSQAITWSDTSSNTAWSGIPLYKLVDWYQNSGSISSSVLSLGYNVSIVAGDGYTVDLNSTRVQANNDIIIANQANGTTLQGAYYPLTLTGANMTKPECVKNIAQIKITTSLPNITLTLMGTNKTKYVLTTNDLAALPIVSGTAGMSSHGNIVGVGTYTGFSLQTLVNLVGGMPDGSFVRLTADDNFTKDFNKDQIINGIGYNVFDPISNTATTATQPINAILAFAYNGALLPSSEGPLRSSFISPEGLLTVSNTWVKMVVEVDVYQMA